MKEIKLSQGQVALVDDEYYEFLNQWKWYAYKGINDVFYVARSIKRVQIKMHREILGLTLFEERGDHIDHNGLNNQRGNLRKCTHQQNCKNRSSAKGSSSKYLGVHWKKQINKWNARVVVCNKLKHLGYFTNEADAAKAYNDAAIKYHGEFANLNTILI